MNTKIKILLAEDEPSLGQIIKESLSDPKEKKYHVNHFIFDFR